MAIRRANRPTITNGHATGTISSFDIERIPVPRKEGRMTVTEDVETYIMRVAVDGITGQTVPMSTTLGMHLNDDPVNFEELQSSPRAKKRYNKLTTTLMKLELIDESELATADDARLEQLDNDIAGLVKDKVKIRFKPARVPEKMIFTIDIMSIERIHGEESAPEEKSTGKKTGIRRAAKKVPTAEE